MDYKMPQRIDSLESYFDTMKSSFTSDEWTTIRKQSTDENKFKEFCRHWSLKESYIKAIG